jgi:hypothetical protein
MDRLRKSMNFGDGPEESVTVGADLAVVIDGTAIGLFVRRR